MQPCGRQGGRWICYAERAHTMSRNVTNKPGLAALRAARAPLAASVALLLCALPASVVAAPPGPRPTQMVRQTARPLRPTKLPPLATREVLDLTIARTDGGLKVLSQKRSRLKKAGVVPRYRGPFEVRLYTRGQLRDVVTFSFPLTLTAGERTHANRRLDAALLGGVRATATVRIPYATNLTHLLLVDKQRRTTTRHSLASLQQNKGYEAGKLPAPQRTDSLGSGRLFGPATAGKPANKPKGKQAGKRSKKSKTGTKKRPSKKAKETVKKAAPTTGLKLP